jgi:hypothetical protein
MGRKILIASSIVLALVLLAFTSIIVYNTLTNPRELTAAEKHAASSEKFFDDLNRAIKEKDEDAFLAPFTGEAKEKQRKLFRNLIKIPFSVARFETPHNGGSTVGGRQFILFVHQIQGIDVAPVYEQYVWDLHFEGSEKKVPWTVSEVGISKESDRQLPGTFAPAPWDIYEDMTVVKQDSVLVVSDKSHTQDARRYAPYIARAAADNVAAWEESGPGDLPTKGAMVILEPDRRAYNTLFLGREENDSLEAGYALALPSIRSVRSKDMMRDGGARVVIDSSSSRFTSAQWQAGVTDISRHEIAHAMTDALAGTQPAEWIAEGFAEYMASRDRPDAAQSDAVRSLNGYPFTGLQPGSQDDFYADNARDRHANYVLSHLAIRYMAEKYGEEKMFRFVVAAYGDPGKTRDSFQTILGVERRDFWDQWASWVRSQVPGIGSW